MDTINIMVAYIYINSDEEVIMILKWILAELLVSIDPNLYSKYVLIEKLVKVLYVRLQKALYGFLCSALLFYLKLVTELKNNDFSIKIYNPCVEDKIVNEVMTTVVWHIDDPKVLHKDSFEVIKFSQYLSTIYGDKIKLHRVNVHYCLYMDLYYSKPGVVKL